MNFKKTLSIIVSAALVFPTSVAAAPSADVLIEKFQSYARMNEVSVSVVKSGVCGDSYTTSTVIYAKDLPNAEGFSPAGYSDKVLLLDTDGGVSIGELDLDDVEEIRISYGGDPSASFDQQMIKVCTADDVRLGYEYLSQNGAFWAQGQREVSVDIDTDYKGEVFIKKDVPNEAVAIDKITLVYRKHVSWSLSEDGTLTISGKGNMYDYQYDDGEKLGYEFLPGWRDCGIDVKKVIIENGITRIGNLAFEYCSSITSVTIPDSVTSIGYDAFSCCSSLTSIEIPGSITKMSSSVFSYCSNLKSVVILDGVTNIGYGAFQHCSNLTSVTIPGSITFIGDDAFYDCENLAEVHIEDVAKWFEIEFVDYSSNPLYYGAGIYFEGKPISDFKIPDGVTSIQSELFYNCSSLVSVVIPDTVTNIGYRAFSKCPNLTSVTISGNVTTMGSDVFADCANLTSVTILDGVTNIGPYAFHRCSKLASITIPYTVNTIGRGAFNSCSSLSSIIVDENNPHFSADEDCVIFNKDKSTLIQYYNNNKISYIIPDSVTSIGDYAFAGNTVLTSVTVPDSVIVIGDYAFAWCNITSIVMGDGVENIGNNAFDFCQNLQSVTIPNTVTSIGASAFSDCRMLNSISIPDNVISIGDSAFSGCELTSITIGKSVSSIGEYAFYGCDELISITVDVDNEYFSNDEYGALFNKDKTILIRYPAGNERKSYHIPDSVTNISENAFSSCDSIKFVTIPDGVTGISHSAFYGCDNLIYVTIPDSVTSIDYYAFYFCDNLTGVYYSGSEEEWEQIAIDYGNSTLSCAEIIFNYTGGLEYDSAVDFGKCGDNLTWILDNEGTLTISGKGNMYNFKPYTSNDAPWYDYNDDIKNIIIENDVTSIGDNAFYDCYNLSAVTIGKNISSIGYKAFYYCDEITSITVDVNNEYFLNDEYGVLFNKDKTILMQYPGGDERKSYLIPDSVTSIGDSAFYYSTALESITIPNSVISIGVQAFCGCTSLVSVVIPDSVTSVGDSAFYHCMELKSVTIPTSVTSIGGAAFYYCNKLANVYYSGSEEEWNKISIGEDNESLVNATIHYNYGKSETPIVPEFTEESEYVFNELVGAVVAKPSAKSGESLDAFIGNIAIDSKYIQVVDAYGTVQTEVKRLTTGYKIQLLDESGNVSNEYTIVILGDIDRNGRFSISDVSGVKTAAMTKPAKNTLEFIEANFDGNSRLSITDASALQSFIANGTGNSITKPEDLSGTYDVTMWVSSNEGVADTFEKQVKDFEAANPGIKINAQIHAITEYESGAKVFADVLSAPDIYCFPQDQLANLVQVGALAKLDKTASETVIKNNDASSAAAAALAGTMYAYPLTSDNGYYMYYDKSIITEEDAESLEKLIAACERNNVKFRYALENSWYTVSFFFATGCHSNWTTNENGEFVSVDDTFASDKGLIAMKGMQKLAKSPAYDGNADIFTDAGVIVTGIWNAEAAAAHFGENLAATDLPSFEVDGTSYHLGSYTGNKLMGVKPQDDAKRAAVLSLLAQFLTNKDCQLERFSAHQWGPSNKDVQKSEEIQNNISLAALLKQGEHGVPQGQIAGVFWDTVKLLGAVAKSAEDDAGLQKGLDDYAAAVKKFIELTPEQRTSFTVIGAVNGTNWDTDFKMKEDPAGTWTSEEALAIESGGEFKVRLGMDWKTAYGDNAANADTSIPLSDKANYVVETAGRYYVKLVINDDETAVITLIPA